MLRLTRLIDGAPASAALAGAVTLRLGWDERSRSRLALLLDSGEAVAVSLPRGTRLRSGAVLASDDGRFAMVEAAPQRLLRVRAGSTLQMMRAVYHLANRHVAAQIGDDHVLIEPDAVLAAMLARLGATVEEIESPFEPEPGAYDGAAHAHRHGDGAAAADIDEVSATLGEQLSIEAHRRRAPERR